MSTENAPSKIRLGIIGTGGMARYHITNILKQADTTEVVVVCEPNGDNYEKAAEMFDNAGQPVPPNEANFDKLIKKYKGKIDAAFIVTPHNEHFPQATALMEAGIDVLIEKPMVLNTNEARKLLKTRDKTGRLLMVAFNGSSSPSIRIAAEMLQSGELGKILNVQAAVWQTWEQNTKGLWRQEPKISGGGYMFDTGAHLLNTVSDLIGEPFAEVAAFIDKRKTKVDILTVAIAKTQSGAYVTINGCGAAPVTGTDIKIWCEKGMMETGVWGGFLRVQKTGEKEMTSIELPPFLGVWQTFVRVRRGEIPNPCPGEIGLRMIQLWDAIKASAAKKGAVVEIKSSAAKPVKAEKKPVKKVEKKTEKKVEKKPAAKAKK
jgi:predicted dehydrogenase